MSFVYCKNLFNPDLITLSSASARRSTSMNRTIVETVLRGLSEISNLVPQLGQFFRDYTRVHKFNLTHVK